MNAKPGDVEQVKPTNADLNKLARMCNRSRAQIDGLMSVRGNRKTARSWRWGGVTEKQRAWLLGKGVPGSVVDACDRGMAATIMSVMMENSREAWAWGFGGGRISDHDFT